MKNKIKLYICRTKKTRNKKSIINNQIIQMKQ